MAILAGLDEAGVGPRLGPLVAASSSFRMPEGMVGASLWELLAPVVRRGGRGLLVADSKVLYRGHRDRAGLRRLEHGVLAFLGAGGTIPKSGAELLSRVSASPSGDERTPWYSFAGMALPLAAPAADIQRDSWRLAARLAELGVEPPQIACEVVSESAFNGLLASNHGKGEVILAVTGRLLRRLPADRGRVYLDRQGGRRRYGPWLQELFPEAFVWTQGENATLSRYWLERGGDLWWEVVVSVGCEARQLPVALASMVAKYVRELHMVAFNRFWAERVPHLVPTAGYPADAARFVGEISGAAQREGLSVGDLLRRR